jgi:hypothetical protein
MKHIFDYSTYIKENSSLILCHENDKKNLKNPKAAISAGKAVLTLKNMLKIKGFLKAMSFQNTDIFDDETRTAVIEFQKANGLKPDAIVGNVTLAKLKDVKSKASEPTTKQPTTKQPTTKQPTSEDGWFSKIINYAKSKIDDLTELLRIPTHYRMAWLFLGTNKKLVNENFFTKNELITLYQIIEYKKTKTKQEVTELIYPDYSAWAVTNGDNENVYKNTMKFMSKHFKDGGEESSALTTKSMSSQLSMSFGSATIKKMTTGYTLIDNYDFNQAANRPKEYEWNKFFDTFGKSIDKIKDGNVIGGAEDILSWAHKMGYKGYPVRVNINPKELGIQDNSKNV